MAQNRIKIISDGTELGTVVLGPDGRALPGVRAISFVCQVGAAPEALVHFQDIECELEIHGELFEVVDEEWRTIDGQDNEE